MSTHGSRDTNSLTAIVRVFYAISHGHLIPFTYRYKRIRNLAGKLVNPASPDMAVVSNWLAPRPVNP